MTHCVKTFLAAALVAAAFVSRAYAETPEEEIRRTILQLGNDDAKKRDAAEALLRGIGPEVIAHYDRNKEGADPEIARRMKSVFEDWKVRPCASMSGSQSFVRLASWESPDEVPRGWWSYVDDDRMRDWIKARAGKDLQCMIYGLQLPGMWLDAPTVQAALALDEHQALEILARREDLASLSAAVQPAREAALRRAGGNGEEGANVLLWRLGEREPLLRSIREKRLRLDGSVVSGVSLDAEACDALADSYADREDSRGALMESHPSAAYLDAYVREEQADLIARLRPVDARKGLQALLAGSPIARFQAAVWLASMGDQVEGLDAFDAREIRTTGFLPECFPAIALQIPGDRVEIRLRNLVDEPELDLSCVERALCALAARGRKKDITFIYAHLESINTDSMAPVAIALARLGSAAGIGVLLPHLSSPDPRVRFPAARALRAIIGEAFDYDPDASLVARSRSARKWAAWWKDNKSTFEPAVK
ncbi:MAG: hypothetical protein K8T20_08970 [Planctomycetes bacterium]|nr:hypothetical protein [Planctomycetota bacterium]